MSESILKALMQLFAIIANVNKEGVSSKSRAIVESYLSQQLSKYQVEEYLKLFDDYVAFHHRDITKKDGTKVKKRTSSNSVKVLRICEQINEELRQEQKILTVLQLLEFIGFGEDITEKEYDFVRTVADVFNIPEREYLNCLNFTLEPDTNKIPNKEDVLIIDNNESATIQEIKHLQYPNLQGNITILFLPSTNMYALRYEGETNLFLNGHIILPRRTYILPKGTAIRSHKIGSIYYSDIVSKFITSLLKHQIDFVAKNVEFRFKNSTNGIHNFNFKAKGGELIGIMGGSGVGKSTLLNVLNGNLKPQSGSITINGNNINSENEDLEGLIGFVPQDDLLIDELTVYQNLYYNAKLCFKQYNEQQIDEAVNRVLEDLDLKEIAHLTVGNPLKKYISGGQRKRLNIALELIREPWVLFVDEPTSGLSSMDSEIVMDLMKEQSSKGKLVIINIHQPSSDIFKMFDKLLIMDKGGYLVYSGNPADSVVYFKTMSHHVNANESECYNCGNINPEQVLQILESKVVDEYGRPTRIRKTTSEEWAEKYRNNIEKNLQIDDAEEPKALPPNEFKIPNKFKQFAIFISRNIKSKLADKQYMLINFLEAPVLAMILAYFTKYIHGTSDNPAEYVFSANENIPIYLFMAVVVAIFLGLIVSAEEIIKDRQLLKRESFLNLSRFSYINSKVLIMFIISAIQTLSFVVIGNLIMEIHGMTIAHWLILFSVSCVSNLIGLNVSASFNSVVTIYILIPFLVVPQLLFSGTMVKFDKLHKSISSYDHVPVLGDMMPSRWAYEAIAVKQFKDNKYQKHFFYLEQGKSESVFISSYLVPALNNEISKIMYRENNKDRNIQYLQNEIKKLNEQTPKYQFARVEDITTEKLDEQLIQELQKHLKLITKYYQKRQNKASALIDKKVSELSKNDANYLINLKKDNYNDMLASFVLNKQELNKIYKSKDGFVQLMNPIYKAPIDRNGRAHFYSSVKQIGNLQIDTFWFNIIVLWIFSIFLYIVLLFDGLRKLIESISFGKKSR